MSSNFYSSTVTTSCLSHYCSVLLNHGCVNITLSFDALTRYNTLLSHGRMYVQRIIILIISMLSLYVVLSIFIILYLIYYIIMHYYFAD